MKIIYFIMDKACDFTLCGFENTRNLVKFENSW